MDWTMLELESLHSVDWIGHKGYADGVSRLQNARYVHKAQHDLHWCISFNWCNIQCEILLFFLSSCRLHHNKTMLNCRFAISPMIANVQGCKQRKRDKKSTNLYVRESEGKNYNQPKILCEEMY